MMQPANKGDVPVMLLSKRILVTPVLGKLAVENADLAVVLPSNNSTRWIFDVEGRLDAPVIIQLLDSRSSLPVKADLIAGSLLARSPEFYTARPFIDPLENGKLVLRHSDTSVSCKYRVCIDTMHSATR